MLKLIVKLAMFIPLLAAMMYISYRVDPSGLFWGAGFERRASEYMLEGEYIGGYERLDGRALNEAYAKNVEKRPQILINGSSRAMLIDSSFADGKTLYNAGNVGADIYDFFTSYYIFSKEGKEPEIFVMGIDPWIFNDGSENIDKRSDKELYFQFIGEELGFENQQYEKENPYEKYLALIDPSYFQGSVAYYFKDKSAEVSPQPVSKDEIYNQTEVVKCPDGSIIYDVYFRTRDQQVADWDALTTANMPLLRLENFEQLSSEYTRQFEKFIEYLQNKGITIIFYLPPYHPYIIEAALANYDTYHGLFDVEVYLKGVAEKYDIPIYGSYNPYALNLTNTDFMDGLHLRQESIREILPEIGKKCNISQEDNI